MRQGDTLLETLFVASLLFAMQFQSPPIHPLSLLFTSYSFTQVSTVKGRVLDSNGFALPGATIQASPSGKAVVTDFDGFYTIVGIEGNQTNCLNGS